jgi:hypothetical protein
VSGQAAARTLAKFCPIDLAARFPAGSATNTRFGHLDPAQTTFGQLFRGAGYATGLIGKQIDGVDDNGNPAAGVVDRVSVAGNVAKLHVGGQIVSLSNIQEILPN